MPYESPFVRDARKTALNRAKRARQNKNKQPIILAHTSSINIPSPASPLRARQDLYNAKPWNSDWKNDGYFDSDLKKVEIFKIRPTSGKGGVIIPPSRKMVITDEPSKENKSNSLNTVIFKLQ
jgi:hypothetical protein